MEDPSQDDTPLMRSTSIMYWKKAISHFMNTTAKWNEAAQSGNPTQSKLVNSLIKVVKRAETRGHGVPSKAERPYTIREFHALLKLLPNEKMRAFANFQYHLMGRSDDIARVKKKHLKASTEFEGFLTTKICWSKNVINESNSPTQILLGSKDPEMCVYLNLAIFLEKWIQYGDGAMSQWLFCEGNTTDASPFKDQDYEAILGKRAFARAVRNAVDHASFERDYDGLLGTHSIRKSSVTECRKKGAKKDDVDYRGRWKTVTRMQDRYTDVQLNWPDVEMASLLCQEGCIKYKVKSELGLTDEWLCANVTPNISSTFGRKVGAILAKSLLWAVYNPTWSEKVQPDIRHRIISACIRKDVPDDVNPVDRVQVVATEGEIPTTTTAVLLVYIQLTNCCFCTRMNRWRNCEFG